MTAAIGAIASSMNMGGLGGQLLGTVVNAGLGAIQNKITGNQSQAISAAPKAAESRGMMLNKNSNNAPIPVIYGERIVGGTRLFMDSSDGAGSAGTEYLNIVLALAEGECGDVTEIRFGDKQISGSALRDYSTTGDAAVSPSYEIHYHSGKDTQVTDPMLSTSIGSSWGVNHRLQGIAYLAIKLKADANFYEGQLPTIITRLKGKLVRDVSTVDGTELFINSNNQNPVDVLADYLTNARYGKGLSDSDIYWGDSDTDNFSFKKARADVGSNFPLNGILYTEDTLFNNAHMLAETANMYLIYSNGLYRLHHQQQNEVSTREITTLDILSDIKLIGNNKKVRMNKIVSTYNNAFKVNMPDESRTVDNATYLAADSEVLEKSMEFPFFTSPVVVDAVSNMKLNQSRNQRMIDITLSHTFLTSEVGDIVSFTHPAMGFDQKLFRIMRMALNTDNTIDVILLEYVSASQI